MKLSIILSISLIVSTFVAGIAQGAQLGLVGAWLLDEGSGKAVKDAVSGNNGEIAGSLKWADGKTGKGLEFAGAGDSYISIPHKDYMDADPYTIAAWVKLQNASWQYIFWKDGLVWPEVHLKRHIDMWVHEADYPVIMWHLDPEGGEGRIDAKTIIADDKWHHVAESSDGKNMRLVIDGKIDGEAPIGGKLVVNNEDPLWIGARPGNVAATGIFDEIGFFTKALSEDEFTEVMNKGLAVIASVEPGSKLASAWGKLKLNE